MPLQSEEARRVAAALAYDAQGGAPTAQIAEAIVATWRQVDTALSPILGRRGVAALFERSLLLAASAHSWLAQAHQGAQPSLDLATLESLLLEQTSACAAAAGGDLLQNFCALLASLVGSSFTERLLHPVWDRFPIDLPTQDSHPSP